MYWKTQRYCQNMIYKAARRNELRRQKREKIGGKPVQPEVRSWVTQEGLCEAVFKPITDRDFVLEDNHDETWRVDLADLLEQLPDIQRRVMTLVTSGVQTDYIAWELKMHPTTVTKHIRAAQERLRELLDD